MTENPYDILGVSRDASPDEVKKAYRKKAREAHPDLNPDDPTAAERMNKVNEAYDRIMNPEKYAREDARRRAAAYGAPYSPGYGRPGAGPQQPGRYQEALSALEKVVRSGRNARWHYLMALASHGAGQLTAALGHIRRARQMDPANTDYLTAERSFTQRAAAYQQQGESKGFSMGFLDPTNLCCCLCWGSMLCGPGIPAAICCL